MTPVLKAFIERHINLIEDNQFEQLYELTWQDYGDIEQGELTEVLESCEIYPIEHVKNLPYRYYAHSNKEEIRIPPNITSIEPEIIAMSNVRILYLPKTIKVTGDEAFIRAYKLEKIVYEGTKEEFQQIQNITRAGLRSIEIDCSDGSIVYWGP